MGFRPEDCAAALENCANKLDDAALWLTNNGKPDLTKPAKNVFSINAVEVGVLNSNYVLLVAVENILAASSRTHANFIHFQYLMYEGFLICFSTNTNNVFRSKPVVFRYVLLTIVEILMFLY